MPAIPAWYWRCQPGRVGGTAPAILNAANEIAVQAFLEQRIAFTCDSVSHQPDAGTVCSACRRIHWRPSWRTMPVHVQRRLNVSDRAGGDGIVNGFLFSLVSFVVAIGVLVTVHEYGHFWVARRLGVKVLRFSIGFGKPLWTRTFGRDATELVVASIPLGGYVRMLDEREGEVAEEELPRAFNRQPVSTRIAVVIAGPAFNFHIRNPGLLGHVRFRSAGNETCRR